MAASYPQLTLSFAPSGKRLFETVGLVAKETVSLHHG